MKHAPLRGCGAFLGRAPAACRASVAGPSTWRISWGVRRSHDHSVPIRRWPPARTRPRRLSAVPRGQPRRGAHSRVGLRLRSGESRRVPAELLHDRQMTRPAAREWSRAQRCLGRSCTCHESAVDEGTSVFGDPGSIAGSKEGNRGNVLEFPDASQRIEVPEAIGTAPCPSQFRV